VHALERAGIEMVNLISDQKQAEKEGKGVTSSEVIEEKKRSKNTKDTEDTKSKKGNAPESVEAVAP